MKIFWFVMLMLFATMGTCISKSYLYPPDSLEFVRIFKDLYTEKDQYYLLDYSYSSDRLGNFGGAHWELSVENGDSVYYLSALSLGVGENDISTIKENNKLPDTLFFKRLRFIFFGVRDLNRITYNSNIPFIESDSLKRIYIANSSFPGKFILPKSENNLIDIQISANFEVNEFPKIESDSLRFLSIILPNSLFDTFDSKISDLCDCPNLKHLTLGFSNESETIQFPALDILNLESIFITMRSEGNVNIEELTSLKSLSLSNCSIAENNDFTNATIEKLYLVRCNLKNAPEINAPNLKNLILLNNLINNLDGFEVSKYPKLATFQVDFNKLTLQEVEKDDIIKAMDNGVFITAGNQDTTLPLRLFEEENNGELQTFVEVNDKAPSNEFIWYINGEEQEEDTLRRIKVSKTGIYNCYVRNNRINSSLKSDTVIVKTASVNENSGIETKVNFVKSQNAISIKAPSDQYLISITDLNGKLLYREEKMISESILLPAASYSTGVYLITIENQGRVINRKIIIER